MTNDSFYSKEDFSKEDAWQVRTYFDIAYSTNRFEAAVLGIAKKIGYGVEESGCCFPDMDSFEEYDHFEGVYFETGANTEDSNVLISEEKCLELLKEAINKYLEKHPERKSAVDDIWKESVW